MTEAFFVALLFTFVSEIADKTQLVILGLALKYRATFQVFLGALIAHSFMDMIAISLGYFFSFSISSSIAKKIIGLAFILLGVYGLFKLYAKKSPKNEKKEKMKIKSGSPFAVSFIAVLLSEFGDKTQISSGLLAAKYSLPLQIFIGAFLALAFAIGLNVFIGAKIAEKLPARTIKTATSALFIMFGMITLFA